MRTFLITLLCIAGLSGSISAQGIDFIHDLDEAMSLAKKENKLVFVDFYTSWCSPCKKLSKEVFPQEKIGSYFNANFISCKIQCDDKGEGEKLQKKYQIQSYPTLMFLNGDGEIIHSKSGAPSAEGLLKIAKNASNPELNLITIVKKYESGDRSKEVVKEYFSKMKAARRNVKALEDFSIYFNALSDKEKQSNFIYDLVVVLDFRPFTEEFDYIEANKNKYYSIRTQDEVDAFIKMAYLKYLGSNHKDGVKYSEALAKFKLKGYSFYDEFKEYLSVVEVMGIKGIDRKKEFAKRGDAFMKKYGHQKMNYAYPLSGRYGNLFFGKDKGVEGIKWMEDLLKRDRSAKYLRAYASILIRNGRFDEAKKVKMEMRDVYVKHGYPTAPIDKEIKKIEELKLKYN